MIDARLSAARWRSSFRSVANGSRVELANVGTVRDSKNPGPVLVDVAALVAAVVAGRLGWLVPL